MYEHRQPFETQARLRHEGVAFDTRHERRAAVLLSLEGIRRARLATRRSRVATATAAAATAAAAAAAAAAATRARAVMMVITAAVVLVVLRL